MGKHLLQDKLVPADLDDADPLAFMLTDADVEVLVSGQVHDCLVFARLDDLDTKRHLTVEEGQSLNACLSSQYPIRLERFLLIELSVLEINVVAHIVAVRVALEDEDMVSRNRDCRCRKTKQQTQKADELTNVVIHYI